MDAIQSTFQYVDAHEGDFINGLFELLRIPSIAVEKTGLYEVAGILKETMVALGFNVEVAETSGSPIVFGERFDNSTKPTILIYGHYDVQSAEPIAEWRSPPFEPTIRDGRIYARGVADNKGQLYAQLMGIKSYLATNGSLPVNIKTVFEGEEENDSPNLRGFILSHKDRLKSDFAYLSDGPLHESGRPTIVLGVRGIISIEVKIKGPSRDLHSGNWGGSVLNPAWKLTRLLSTMRDPDSRKITIDGFYDGVRPITPEDREATRKIPFNGPGISRDLQLPQLARLGSGEFYEPIMFWPVLNICALQAGADVLGVKTIIPSVARAKIDIRLVSDQNPDHIFAKFSEHVKKNEPDAEVIRYGQMWPTRTSLSNPYVKKIAAAVARAHEIEPLIVPCAGGSLPIYLFTEILGIPVISVPYANADEANHAPNENLVVANFFKGIRTCASVIDHIGRE